MNTFGLMLKRPTSTGFTIAGMAATMFMIVVMQAFKEFHATITLTQIVQAWVLGFCTAWWTPLGMVERLNVRSMLLMMVGNAMVVSFTPLLLA